MSDKRKCIICGKEYEYCPRCPQKYNSEERWRLMFCSENCKSISELCNLLAFNHITIEEAQDVIKTLDMSNRENFADNIKNELNKIPEAVKKEETIEPKVVKAPATTSSTTTISSKTRRKKKTNIVND